MKNTEPKSGRFAWRATATDLAHIETIAAALRANGHPFCTRADVIRYCLAGIASDAARVVAESAQ